MMAGTTKVKLGAKGVRGAVRHPGLVRAGAKGGTLMTRIVAQAAMPFVKRRARRVATVHCGLSWASSSAWFLNCCSMVKVA